MGWVTVERGRVAWTGHSGGASQSDTLERGHSGGDVLEKEVIVPCGHGGGRGLVSAPSVDSEFCFQGHGLALSGTPLGPQHCSALACEVEGRCPGHVCG